MVVVVVFMVFVILLVIVMVLDEPSTDRYISRGGISGCGRMLSNKVLTKGLVSLC